jgi:hypothetical protein
MLCKQQLIYSKELQKESIIQGKSLISFTKKIRISALRN